MLRKTARQMGVIPSGELRLCTGRSKENVFRKASKRSTNSGATLRQSVCTDLGGRKVNNIRWEESVHLENAKRLAHSSRWCTSFDTIKLDTIEAFKRFLSDTRAHGVLFVIVIVRSDDEGWGGGGWYARGDIRHSV